MLVYKKEPAQSVLPHAGDKQPFSMCRRPLLGVERKILSIRKKIMLSGFSRCSEHLTSC